MTKPITAPQKGHAYKDAHGALVTVHSINHNRVTFYRAGYEHPCVQTLEHFINEFREVAR